jgi:hypothetical protein
VLDLGNKGKVGAGGGGPRDTRLPVATLLPSFPETLASVARPGVCPSLQSIVRAQ